MDDKNEKFKEIINELMTMKSLKCSQMRFLLCIAYRCSDNNFEDTCIKTSDFIKFSELSRGSINESIKSLLEDGIIRRSKVGGKVYKYGIVLKNKKQKDEEMIVNEKPVKTEKKKVAKSIIVPKNKKNGYGNWKNNKSVGKNGYSDIDVEKWNYDNFGAYMYDCLKFNCKKQNIALSSKAVNFSRGMMRNMSITNCLKFINKYSGDKNCKFVFKAYIGWFMRSVAIKILMKENSISSSSLSQEWNLENFIKAHNLIENDKEESMLKKLKSYKRVVGKSSKVCRIKETTKEIMDDKYDFGISSLLSECGIVLAGNYLIKYRGKTFQQAAKEIHLFLRDMNIEHGRQKNALIKIAEVTCVKSPYYNKMRFLNWRTMFKDVFSKLDEDFDFRDFKVIKTNNENYNFLINK